jgi:hypothetical protein
VTLIPTNVVLALLSVKYPGRFFMGFEKDRPEQEETAKFDKVTYNEPTKVIIDRTLAFDTVIHQMMTGGYILPPELEVSARTCHVVITTRSTTHDPDGARGGRGYEEVASSRRGRRTRTPTTGITQTCSP